MAEDLENQEDGENSTAQKKSSSLVLIIIISILLITLIIGGIIVASLVSGDDEDVSMYNEDQTSQSSSKRGSRPDVRAKASKRIEGLDVGPMYPLDGFTINLLSDSGRRYLKTTINLELMDEETAAELESKDPVIRDIMIRVLTSKTLEEIATAKGKEKLKDQLVNQVNLRLRDGEIKNVYFVEFVIQ